jgi:predicted small lipoprotein YifL
MKIKTIIYLTLITIFTLTSCGRKGALEYPEGQKRPKFDKVIDED